MQTDVVPDAESHDMAYFQIQGQHRGVSVVLPIRVGKEHQAESKTKRHHENLHHKTLRDEGF